MPGKTGFRPTNVGYQASPFRVMLPSRREKLLVDGVILVGYLALGVIVFAWAALLWKAVAA